MRSTCPYPTPGPLLPYGPLRLVAACLPEADALSRPIHPDHMSNGLSANGTRLDLFRAFNTSTHVAAVVEQRIYLLCHANLAHVTLLIGHFPIGYAFPPPLSVLESAHVPVFRPLLYERALAMLLILQPGALIDVAVLVGHLAVSSRTLACHIWTMVSLPIRRDVSR